MANRYQSDNQGRRDPYRGYRDQEEQFDTGFGPDEERSFGQMGDGPRGDYGGRESWQSQGRYGREREREDYRPSIGERFGARRSERSDYDRFTGSDFRTRDRDTDRYRGRDAADRTRDAFSYGAGSQLAAAHGEWRDPDGFGTGSYGRTSGHRGASDSRGFLERAGDEIAGWFGDDDAQRRTRQDYRGHGPSGYTRSDERIRDDVNDRLTDDSRVDARNITVTVSGGEVTLDGTVSSRDQKRRAEDVVEDLSGVKHVQNNLRVSEGTTWDRNNSGDATPSA